jgi:hypothetical protein
MTFAGKGGPSQQEQARLWKAFLEYERSNPQRLEQSALTQRVELAYMQALMCLLHFPEVSLVGLLCLTSQAWGPRCGGDVVDQSKAKGVQLASHHPRSFTCSLSARKFVREHRNE